jgi:hypothetical protein
MLYRRWAISLHRCERAANSPGIIPGFSAVNFGILPDIAGFCSVSVLTSVLAESPEVLYLQGLLLFALSHTGADGNAYDLAEVLCVYKSRRQVEDIEQAGRNRLL